MLTIKYLVLIMANDTQYLMEAIGNLTEAPTMANDHQHLMELLLNTKNSCSIKLGRQHACLIFIPNVNNYSTAIAYIVVSPGRFQP